MNAATAYFLAFFAVLFGAIALGAVIAALRSRGDRLQLGTSIAVLVVAIAAFIWLGAAWMGAQCNPPPGSACA